MSEFFNYSTIPNRQNQVYIPEKCSGYGLAELIKNIQNPIGIEIGLAEGFTTEFLMQTHDTLILYCVDPYVNYTDWNGNNLNERESVYQQFLNNTKRFGNRIKFLRKFSDDAVSDIEDNSLDFIFIDGLHTYNQVTKDMINYYPKLKNKGIFSGHDYKAIQCINEAVNAFAKEKQKSVFETECDVWYWYK